MLKFMSDVTRILSALEAGDPKAPELLLPIVYEELLSPANVDFTIMILKRPRPRSSWSNST
jgi:hypothetical protein